jgi:hypothetical protein
VALDFSAAAFAPDPGPCLAKNQAQLVMRAQLPCDLLRDQVNGHSFFSLTSQNESWKFGWNCHFQSTDTIKLMLIGTNLGKSIICMAKIYTFEKFKFQTRFLRGKK